MPANDEFLTAYFTDSQMEMRWRREVEYKLLAFLIPLCPALVAGLFALSTVAATPVTVAAALALTVFVWILYWYVSQKVKAENAIYKVIGQTTVRIWEYFDLFTQGAYASKPPILLDGSRNYGAGTGYKRTLRVFLAICIATTVMLLGIGAFAAAQSLVPSEALIPDDTMRVAASAAKAADPKTKKWRLHSLSRSDDGDELTVLLLREGQDNGYAVSIRQSNQSVSRLEQKDIRAASPTVPILSLEEAQERLYVLGHYKGSIDGRLGPLTRRAIQSFQRAHGLPMTSELDQATNAQMSATPLLSGRVITHR